MKISDVPGKNLKKNTMIYLKTSNVSSLLFFELVEKLWCPYGAVYEYSSGQRFEIASSLFEFHTSRNLCAGGKLYYIRGCLVKTMLGMKGTSIQPLIVGYCTQKMGTL